MTDSTDRRKNALADVPPCEINAAKIGMGERLSALMGAAGMTQSELAEAIDASKQSVSKWVTNKGLPSLDKLVSLSRVLNVSLNELIPIPVEGADARETVGLGGPAQFAEVYNSLDDRAQDDLYQIAVDMKMSGRHGRTGE